MKKMKGSHLLEGEGSHLLEGEGPSAKEMEHQMKFRLGGTAQSLRLLKKWLKENHGNLHPTLDDKILLSNETGLPLKKVT